MHAVCNCRKQANTRQQHSEEEYTIKSNQFTKKINFATFAVHFQFSFFLQREQIPYARCWSLVKRVKQRLRNTVHQQPVDQFSHVAPSTSINTSNGLYQQHNVKIMQPQVATDNTDHYYHEFSYFTDIFGLEIVCNSNTSTSILNLTSVAD